MARLYANENFPMPVVEELSRLGHDTLTSYESGRSNQSIPDEEVLSFAFNEERPTFIAQLKQWKLACPRDRLDLVFPSDEGTPIDNNNIVKRHFESARRLDMTVFKQTGDFLETFEEEGKLRGSVTV